MTGILVARPHAARHELPPAPSSTARRKLPLADRARIWLRDPSDVARDPLRELGSVRAATHAPVTAVDGHGSRHCRRERP